MLLRNFINVERIWKMHWGDLPCIPENCHEPTVCGLFICVGKYKLKVVWDATA